jgi:hypothetical protein
MRRERNIVSHVSHDPHHNPTLSCITHDRKLKHLEIDQSGYLHNVLERFGMADANPHSTPLPAGAEEHLIKYDGQASASDIKHYQSLIGSLMYLQIGM